MDRLLQSYLDATDESEERARLDDLLLVHAALIVRKVLRRRLGFFVSSLGVNDHNRDAEDLYQEAMTRIAQMLHDLRISPTKTDIASFRQYVARVTANVCVDYLRKKSPARTRLKYSLWDIFKRQKELAVWEYEGKMLCGFAAWRNTGKTFFSDQASSDLEGRSEAFQAARFPHEDVKQALITQVLAELFDWIGGPVELDTAVSMMAILLDVREQPIASLDEEPKSHWKDHFLVSASITDSEVRAKELLNRLWQVVRNLPDEQRDAYAFGFEDDNGQDLFTLLLSNGVVTLGELSREFGRPAEEIVLLSARMPMDPLAIATELKASRDNVYKWRSRAIQRVRAGLSSA
jgi:RNA polymerase sigma factor (sigma-70 family)